MPKQQRQRYLERRVAYFEKIADHSFCLLKEEFAHVYEELEERVATEERETTRKASVSTFPIMFSIMFTIMFPMDFCSLIKIKKRKKKSLDSKTKMRHSLLITRTFSAIIGWRSISDG